MKKRRIVNHLAIREISPEMAKYLFNSQVEVFRLYTDGTEAVIEDIGEIETHDGVFGIEE